MAGKRKKREDIGIEAAACRSAARARHDHCGCGATSDLVWPLSAIVHRTNASLVTRRTPTNV